MRLLKGLILFSAHICVCYCYSQDSFAGTSSTASRHNPRDDSETLKAWFEGGSKSSLMKKVEKI
jgi:hypothetical protein